MVRARVASAAIRAPAWPTHDAEPGEQEEDQADLEQEQGEPGGGPVGVTRVAVLVLNGFGHGRDPFSAV